MKEMTRSTCLLVLLAIATAQAQEVRFERSGGEGWSQVEVGLAVLCGICGLWFIHSMIARTDKVESDLNAARKQLAAVEGECGELKNQMGKARAELDTVTRRQRELSASQEEDRRVAGEKRQKLFQQITSLERQHELKCREQKELESRVERITTEMTERAVATKAAIDSLDSRTNSRFSAHKEATDSLDRRTDRRFSAQRGAVDSLDSRTSARFNAHKGAIDRIDRSHSRFSLRLTAQRNAIDSLDTRTNSRFSAQKSAVDVLDSRSSAQRNAIDSLDSRTNMRFSAQKTAVDSLDTRTDARFGAHKTAISRIDTRDNNYHQRINAAKSAIDTLDSRMERTIESERRIAGEKRDMLLTDINAVDRRSKARFEDSLKIGGEKRTKLLHEFRATASRSPVAYNTETAGARKSASPNVSIAARVRGSSRSKSREYTH